MREEIIREVEQFLYREARLLDARRFHEWLELLTDDVRYWMPVRTSRYPKVSKAINILTRRATKKRNCRRRARSPFGRDENDAEPPHRAPGVGHGLG